MPHCGYTLGLKWNLHPADLTEYLNLSLVVFEWEGGFFLPIWYLFLPTFGTYFPGRVFFISVSSTER